MRPNGEKDLKVSFCLVRGFDIMQFIRLIFGVGIFLVMILIFFNGANIIAVDYQPQLYNDMPGYLEDFKLTVERQAQKFPEVFYLNYNIKAKVVALTFDDGPDRINTPLLLDILKEKRAIATFFLIGSSVQEEPAIIRRIKDEGHQIANHSWSHPDFRDLGNKVILEEELYSTSELIEELTGTYPLYIRPPYGAINDKTIEVLGEKGWEIINWSIDSFDWDKKNNKPEQILEKVKKYIHPGAVILMHSGENNGSTVVALPGIIDFLRMNGYEFKTVRELLNLINL